MNRLLLLIIAAFAARAATPADSARGERLFKTLRCVECHQLHGRGETAGGTVGPDLGRAVHRDFSPSSLAATMWNHAPRMWAAMRERGNSPGKLDEAGAADLFAFFYAERFFEKPGDAGRGKRLFSVKQCSTCHGLTDQKVPNAPPVAQWSALSEPIALGSALWNHAAEMGKEFTSRRLAWPQITPQDLADMLVYLRNLPGMTQTAGRMELTAGTSGAELFQSKGCSNCHHGKLTLERRLKGKTLTGIAIDLWNHAPRMTASPPHLEPGELRELASFLWSDQFFLEAGNARAGQRVFRRQKCVACHQDRSSGAPYLPEPQTSFSGATMVAALWSHGPQMQEQMTSRRLPWPRFERSEMQDLIAYLGSSRTGK
jgi:mono/diheme cytochrome c family protein